MVRGALEGQLHRKLNLARCTLCVHARAEPKTQTIGLRVSGPIRGTVAAIENAAEWNTRTVKIGKVEYIEESDARPKFNSFPELVGPAQAQVERLQPRLPDCAWRSQLQRAVSIAASGYIATDYASQLLQLRQREQAIVDEVLSRGRRLTNKAIVESRDLLVQATNGQTPAKGSNIGPG